MNVPAFLHSLTEREKEEKDQRQRDQPARSSTARGGGDGYGAAGSPSGAEPASAGASSSSTRPAGPAAASTAAGRAADGGDRRGAGQSEAASGLRARRSQSQRGPKPLYTTPFGGKYHCDRECHGLRHASEICLTPRCHRCGPQSDTPQYVLYAISHGYALHVDYEHCRDAGSNGPLRMFNPCAICCTSEDRIVERA